MTVASVMHSTLALLGTWGLPDRPSTCRKTHPRLVPRPTVPHHVLNFCRHAVFAGSRLHGSMAHGIDAPRLGPERERTRGEMRACLELGSWNTSRNVAERGRTWTANWKWPRCACVGNRACSGLRCSGEISSYPSLRPNLPTRCCHCHHRDFKPMWFWPSSSSSSTGTTHDSRLTTQPAYRTYCTTAHSTVPQYLSHLLRIAARD